MGTFYAIAIVAAATRLLVQVRVYRRLQVEDFFLIGACACLTAATLLTFIKFSDLYHAEVFGLNAGLLPIPDDVGQRSYSSEDLYYSAPVLAWTAIFFVKFAYLSFFKVLVNQLRKLKIFRNVLMAMVAISWVVCISTVYISCTKRGFEAGKSSFLPRPFKLLIFITGSDLSRAQIYENATRPCYICYNVGYNHRHYE